MLSARQAALNALIEIIDNGRSSREIFPVIFADLPPQDKGFAQALTLGVLRRYEALLQVYKTLVQKPFKEKDLDVELVLLLGFYQLLYLQTDDHAAVNESVNLCKNLKKTWSVKLCNAVLRNVQREREELLEAIQKNLHKHHPLWLRRHFQQDWPENWRSIVINNNTQAPMFLRAPNRDRYLTELSSANIEASAHPDVVSAIELAQPQAVQNLPNFDSGLCSVQDPAAQLATLLLNPNDNDVVLDACAAPGGKTGHILEHAQCKVTALEIDARRATRIDENLQRLGLADRCEIKTADGCDLDAWWDGKPFDKILLDAPCSATGVIRRHPDIKLLRHADDIQPLVDIQQQLLNALWQTLKPGGVMLYATCSVLQLENQQQIERFLSQTADAKLINIDFTLGINTGFGRQLLPNTAGLDGFFYSLLQKQ